MNIITNENILRKQCLPIVKESPKIINGLISGMLKLMSEQQGIGIASPQVGVHKRIFLAVLDYERVELFINPVITGHSEDMTEDIEGCLSVPNQCGTVARYNSVTIKYFNGKEHLTKIYEGMNARIIQHEYDHLQGTLYIDKATDVHIVEDNVA